MSIYSFTTQPLPNLIFHYFYPMQNSFYEKKFQSIEASQLELGEYEACSFKGINFLNANLSEFKFIECQFENCNLSNAQLHKTSFQDCKFTHSKLLGLHFEECNGFNFSIHFQNCQLNHSSFYQMNLCNSSFQQCSLQGVDFIESKLENGKLLNCDLLNAQFERTNLVGCDLRGCTHLQIHPEFNSIQKAQIFENQLIGFLSHYQLKVDSIH